METRLRPCIVRGESKALFHCWEHWANVVDASLLKGGHPGGQISVVYGICEFEDGTIARVDPSQIRFIPGKMKDYSFAEV